MNLLAKLPINCSSGSPLSCVRFPRSSKRSGRSTVPSESSSRGAPEGGRSYLSFISCGESLVPSLSRCFRRRCLRFRSPSVSVSLCLSSPFFLDASGECISFAPRSNLTRLVERARGVLTPSIASEVSESSFWENLVCGVERTDVPAS